MMRNDYIDMSSMLMTSKDRFEEDLRKNLLLASAGILIMIFMMMGMIADTIKGHGHVGAIESILVGLAFGLTMSFTMRYMRKVIVLIATYIKER